jgi:hypothetical protein
MPGNFCGMLVAESVDGLKSYGLKGVDEMIANHIDLDGLPLRNTFLLYSTPSYCGGSM